MFTSIADLLDLAEIFGKKEKAHALIMKNLGEGAKKKKKIKMNIVSVRAK